jgi:hypothetical protein
MNLLWALPGKIAAIIIGLYFFSALLKPYRLFLFQVVIAMFVEILGYYLGAVKHQNNLWLFSSYNLVDLWLVGIAGRLLLKESWLKKFIVPLIIIGTILWVLDFYIRGVKEMLIWFTLYQYSILLILYLVLLSGILFKNSNVSNQPIFWVCISILIFYSVSLPYWALFNYINTKHPELALNLFNIKKVLNFIRYPLIGVAFYLLGRQRSQSNTQVQREV